MPRRRHFAAGPARDDAAPVIRPARLERLFTAPLDT